MNPNYTEFKFPQIKAHPWDKVFRSRTPRAAVDLVGRMLSYPPEDRVGAFSALVDPFFDELRDPAAQLADGRDASQFPRLFNFTPTEMTFNPSINHALIPEHARTKDNWPPPVPAGGSAPSASTD